MGVFIIFDFIGVHLRSFAAKALAANWREFTQTQIGFPFGEGKTESKRLAHYF
jgi:hypothetical protein